MSIGERCPICGLPKELCVCGEIAKEQQKVVIKIEKRKYGREVTLIEGIDANDTDVRELVKYLKKKLGCGGTYKKKEGLLLLQGDHKRKLKDMLVEWGIPEDRIEVV